MSPGCTHTQCLFICARVRVAGGRGKAGSVGFANDAQFLLISRDSTDDLMRKMTDRYTAAGAPGMLVLSLAWHMPLWL